MVTSHFSDRFDTCPVLKGTVKSFFGARWPKLSTARWVFQIFMSEKVFQLLLTRISEYKFFGPVQTSQTPCSSLDKAVSGGNDVLLARCLTRMAETAGGETIRFILHYLDHPQLLHRGRLLQHLLTIPDDTMRVLKRRIETV